ncbi:hypothetical protein ATKI12_0587 [Kitasatospora sp. Ki12]
MGVCGGAGVRPVDHRGCAILTVRSAPDKGFHGCVLVNATDSGAGSGFRHSADPLTMPGAAGA